MAQVKYLFKPDQEEKGRNSEDWLDIGLSRLWDILDIRTNAFSDTFTEAIPFSLNDTTVGAENEFQTVVIGSKQDVDLPIKIETSNYYRNLLKRASTGETSPHLIEELKEFLNRNPHQAWENSYVRFRLGLLSPYARKVFDHDLLADKTNPKAGTRTDTARFFFIQHGERWARIPISYLLKLALADVVSSTSFASEDIKRLGERLMGHFLNDNSSPETFSFCPTPLSRGSKIGQGIARETLKRFMLTQLLIQYANDKFNLTGTGQHSMVYFAPHTPVRLKKLNELISDSFYRELFMSPCLSGWNRGEDKHRYMRLCHEVLSRSQLNAVLKLREAGIITRNLIVLPNLSNLSLANNGTHISLGSNKLTSLLRNEPSEFDPEDEKYVGDLAIKIIEHFLPLFIGTYSAAPHRLDFQDFHPEKLLGFLPHELDFNHLRMIWRRWKKKASLKIFNQPITPFGPKLMDKTIQQVFGLQGDYIQDFRLLDYFVALMSTNQCPALDGSMENQRRLKNDLADMGVFDPTMAFYSLYRMREFSVMGFSGFEGRYYSLFEDIMGDMASATSLQNLITALAFKYILKGDVTHADIPDDPFIESERRQIFFGTAIGIPTFFIRKDTSNAFMKKILQHVKQTRTSARYDGYVRVLIREYLDALIRVIREDGKDLIEMLGAEQTLDDLSLRLKYPDTHSAAGRLTSGILDTCGVNDPLKLRADDFNRASEIYYRDTLRKKHIAAGWHILEQDFKNLDGYAILGRHIYRESLKNILGESNASTFLNSIKTDIAEDCLQHEDLVKLIYLVLLTIHIDITYHEEKEPQ